MEGTDRMGFDSTGVSALFRRTPGVPLIGDRILSKELNELERSGEGNGTPRYMTPRLPVLLDFLIERFQQAMSEGILAGMPAPATSGKTD